MGAVDVDLFGLEGVAGEDGDAVREHFDESPVHVVDLFAAGAAAVDAHVARAQFGEQRRVAVEHFHVAVLRGQFDGVGCLLEEDALGSDQADAKRIGFISHVSSQLLSCQFSVDSRFAVDRGN